MQGWGVRSGYTPPSYILLSVISLLEAIEKQLVLMVICSDNFIGICPGIKMYVKSLENVVDWTKNT